MCGISGVKDSLIKHTHKNSQPQNTPQKVETQHTGGDPTTEDTDATTSGTQH